MSDKQVKTKRTFYLSKEAIKMLAYKAVDDDASQSDIIEKLIREYCAKNR